MCGIRYEDSSTVIANKKQGRILTPYTFDVGDCLYRVQISVVQAVKDGL